MDWNNVSYDYNQRHICDDEFGLIFLLIVFAVIIIMAAGITTIGAFAFHLFDFFLFDNIIHWHIELAFGVICIPIVCFIMSDYSKNPMVWYIHCRKIDVEYKKLEDGEHEEMTKWIDENINGYWIANKYDNNYRFARKSDAVAFKLRWS